MEEGLHTKPEMDASGHAARKTELSKDRIVNAINYLHFQGRAVYAVFKHVQYNTTVTVEAFPFPCHEDYLHLSWKDQGMLKERSSSYAFQGVLVDAGKRIFSLKPDLVDIDEKSISFDISKVVGTDVTVRKAERYPCQGIDVEMAQNGLSFKGRLNDFSAFSFSAAMSLGNFLSFKYITPEIAITVFIKKGGNCCTRESAVSYATTKESKKGPLSLSLSLTIFSDSNRRRTGAPDIVSTPLPTSYSCTRSAEKPYRLR